jgi:hypothetical protein
MSPSGRCCRGNAIFYSLSFFKFLSDYLTMYMQFSYRHFSIRETTDKRGKPASASKRSARALVDFLNGGVAGIRRGLRWDNGWEKRPIPRKRQRNPEFLVHRQEHGAVALGGGAVVLP